MSGEIVSPNPNAPTIHPAHYSDLKETLKRLIVNRYQAGQKFPSDKNLAQQFKVTERKARQSISELIQEGFLYTEDNISIFVSPEIMDKDIKLVGIFISEPIELINWSIYHKIISAIQSKFQQLNIQLIQANFKYNFDEAFEQSKLFLQKKVDGIIFQCISSEYEYSQNKRIIELFERQKIPVVLIDKYFLNEPANYSYVVSNNEQGAFLATEHFIENGYDRIAFIRDAYSSSSILREQGYRKALIHYGIRPKEDYIKIFHSLDEITFRLNELFIQAPKRPHAVLTINDSTANQIYLYLARQGLRVPQDVAIIGFDDMPNSRSLKPPLTTVRQNFSKLGKTAAQFLLERMDKFSTLPKKSFDCELIVRESCGANQKSKPYKKTTTSPALKENKQKSEFTTGEQTTKTIGLLFRGFEDEPYLRDYYSRILKGIYDESKTQGYRTILSTPFDDKNSEYISLKTLLRQNVSGMVFVATHDRFPPSQEELVFLFRRKVPFVTLSHSDISQISTVTIDDRYGSYLAMQHLLKGCRRAVGAILSKTGETVSDIRLRGIYDALNESQFNSKNFFIFRDVFKSGFTHYSAAYLWAKEVNFEKYPLQGLVCYNDAIAQGVIQAFTERKISVPSEVSVIGFDDGIDCEAEKGNLPLTTVHVPGHELGMKAIRQVLEQISTPSKTSKVYIKPKLIVRQSS